MEEKIYSLKEASEYLRASEITLRIWLRDGKIKGHKVGRNWKFLQSELIDFVMNNGKEGNHE